MLSINGLRFIKDGSIAFVAKGEISLHCKIIKNLKLALRFTFILEVQNLAQAARKL